MQEARGSNNGRTLFGLQKLPTDNQIRNLLDPVDPKLLWPVYRQTFRYLQKQGVVKRFRSFANTLLVAVYGTVYFYSESMHCDQYSVAQHDVGTGGIQIGILNVEGNVNGAQIGVLNIAQDVLMSQIGVVNISREMRGMPIRLVSIARNGRSD